MTLENTERLIQGAEILGAARTLGMTDDEGIQVAQATQRRQQRIEERRQQQRAQARLKYGRATSAEEEAAAAVMKELGIDPRGPLPAETDLEDTTSLLTYGQDQSDFQIASPDDKDFGRAYRDDNQFTITRQPPKGSDERPQRVDVVIPDGVPSSADERIPGKLTAAEIETIQRMADNKAYGMDLSGNSGMRQSDPTKPDPRLGKRRGKPDKTVRYDTASDNPALQAEIGRRKGVYGLSLIHI